VCSGITDANGTFKMLRLELIDWQQAMTARQKSAEGIVAGIRPVRVLRHSSPKGGATDKPNRSPGEGLNGPR